MDRQTRGERLPDAGFHLLLLQLPDGVLRFFQALAGRGALLPDHGQLPLDHVVLLRLLRSRHLTLERDAKVSRGESDLTDIQWNVNPGYPGDTTLRRSKEIIQENSKQ